jgi:hypothetical protein
MLDKIFKICYEQGQADEVSYLEGKLMRTMEILAFAF